MSKQFVVFPADGRPHNTNNVCVSADGVLFDGQTRLRAMRAAQEMANRYGTSFCVKDRSASYAHKVVSPSAESLHAHEQVGVCSTCGARTIDGRCALCK